MQFQKLGENLEYIGNKLCVLVSPEINDALPLTGDIVGQDMLGGTE